VKVNQRNKSKLRRARRIEVTEIETKESADRNGTWLQNLNCCKGNGTAS
jgi:hypothetical protein